MPKKEVKFKELSFERLSQDSIPDLLQLQELAFAQMTDDSLLRRNDFDSLAVCFYSPSIVLGVKYHEELIAFGILFYAGESNENLAKDLDGQVNPIDGANVKLIIVKPEYRGNKLQLTILRKLEETAKQAGTKFLCATVSPDNKYSLDNFISAGYQQVKTLIKYGGVKRALFVKYL